MTHPNATVPEDITFADGVHRVWFGWSGGALLVQANLGGSAFRLDDDEFGRLNVARLGPSEDGWVDLAGDLEELSFDAGATDDDGVLTRVEAGRATLVLNDWDGNWDPTNDQSPYYQDWRLGAVVRIHGNAAEQFDVHNPVTDAVGFALFGLFTGRVESIVASGHAEENPVVTVEIVDDISVLTASNPPASSPTGAGDLLEDRVLRIVENVGWDGNVDLNVVHPEWPDMATYQATTLAQSAWTELLLSCDAGLVAPCMGGDGALYVSPLSPDLSLYRKVKFGSADADEVPLVDVQVAYDRAQLRNVVTLGRTGGTAVTITDESSVTRHGRHDWGRTDLPLENDSDVELIARKILGASSEPAPRITAIEVWPQLFGQSLYADAELWIDGALSVTNNLPIYFTLCLLTFQRLATSDLLSVQFTHPMTGREISQLVQVRGVQVRITPDEWQFRFVTSSVAPWFDIWTLADSSDSLAEAEQSRLSRGHRLVAFA